MDASESAQNFFSDSGIDLYSVSKSDYSVLSSISVFSVVDGTSDDAAGYALVLIIFYLFPFYNKYIDDSWEDAAVIDTSGEDSAEYVMVPVISFSLCFSIDYVAP